MTKYTRGEFLKLGTGAGLGLAGLGAGARGTAEEVSLDAGPDLLVLNARVYTIDEALPRAEAFAVKNGRFIAVGDTDDVRNLKTARTEVIDAEGMTVTPGFIDAHTHPAGSGVAELVNVNCDLRSIEAIKEALRKRAAETPPGEWVIGFKYDDTKVAEGRPLSLRDLDDAAPGHPVCVNHRGGHTSWYNTKAFEAAGVTIDTPDPPGGHIYRESGKFTGRVAENANALFAKVIPSESTREQRQAGVTLISELMTKAGLTTVHDVYCGKDSVIAYQDAYHAGEMRFRVRFLAAGDLYQGLKSGGIRTGFGDDWLSVGGVKFVADGSASERTMAMSTPYVGRPEDFGILTMTQEEIDDAVEEAYRAGFQIGIHANGDRAIDMVLNAYERVLKLWPKKDPRLRIEHCSLVNPDLLKRIKATGSIPTPFYTYVYYHGDKWGEYGAEKMQMMFAHKSFLDYGIPVAGASDYVPGPYEPMMAIQSMTTRKDFKGREWGPDQKITVDQALTVCTINGAYAGFEERVKGSITNGKLADFVILGEDPHRTDPDRIKDIPIVRTVVGGETMYPRG